MKFEKTINLTAYEVEYIDRREEKPRTVYQETVALDSDLLAALDRLGLRPAGYISRQFERSGYTVAAIRRGESINARVDLVELWEKTMNEIRLEQFKDLTDYPGGFNDAKK